MKCRKGGRGDKKRELEYSLLILALCDLATLLTLINRAESDIKCKKVRRTTQRHTPSDTSPDVYARHVRREWVRAVGLRFASEWCIVSSKHTA
jgi:hypothetical protein